MKCAAAGSRRRTHEPSGAPGFVMMITLSSLRLTTQSSSGRSGLKARSVGSRCRFGSKTDTSATEDGLPSFTPIGYPGGSSTHSPRAWSHSGVSGVAAHSGDALQRGADDSGASASAPEQAGRSATLDRKSAL